MKLRPYQETAAERCLKQAQQSPALLALPTGTGKTVVMARIAQTVTSGLSTRPVLLLVHTDELVIQAQNRFQNDFTTLIEKAKSKPSVSDVATIGRLHPTVVIASVASLHEERLKRWPRDCFGLVLVDEAHHAVAKTWRRIIEYFDAPTIGVTATAKREGLANLFTLAFRMTLPEAIEEGWLVPPVFEQVQLEGWDLSGLRISGGRDVTDGQLAEALGDRVLRDLMASLVKQCADEKSILFFPSVAASARAADWLSSADDKLPAFHVDGSTPADARRRLISLFRDRDCAALSNCAVLTEGFDCPDASMIAIIRPTRSERLYLQMVGRGLRPDATCISGIATAKERRIAIASSGKPRCRIVDFHGVGARVDFVGPEVLLDGEMPAGKGPRQIVSEKGEPVEYDELGVLLSQQRKAELEREAYESALERRRHELSQASALDVAPADYMGTGNRRASPCTGKQRAKIYAIVKRTGRSQEACNEYWRRASDEWTKSQASAVISRLLDMEQRQYEETEQTNTQS